MLNASLARLNASYFYNLLDLLFFLFETCTGVRNTVFSEFGTLNEERDNGKNQSDKYHQQIGYNNEANGLLEQLQGSWLIKAALLSVESTEKRDAKKAEDEHQPDFDLELKDILPHEEGDIVCEAEEFDSPQAGELSAEERPRTEERVDHGQKQVLDPVFDGKED